MLNLASWNKLGSCGVFGKGEWAWVDVTIDWNA